jgi:hypothetical protein
VRRGLPTATKLASSFDPRRTDLQRITVERAGAESARSASDGARRNRRRSRAVDLALDDPAVEAAVDLLRGEGFFLCALLPEYLEGDVLRLQRLRDPAPAVLAPARATEGGAALLEALARERAA